MKKKTSRAAAAAWAGAERSPALCDEQSERQKQQQRVEGAEEPDVEERTGRQQPRGAARDLDEQELRGPVRGGVDRTRSAEEARLHPAKVPVPELRAFVREAGGEPDPFEVAIVGETDDRPHHEERREDRRSGREGGRHQDAASPGGGVGDHPREPNANPLGCAPWSTASTSGRSCWPSAPPSFGAKLFGELAERVGQPAVLGELLAGIVLGPSVLGLVPMTDGIFLLSEIGVALLLFEVGLETDLEELLKVGAPAMTVAMAGMVLPFAGRLRRSPRSLGYEPLTAIFVGAALTATSIGITARVLSELGMLKTQEGQIILGAAVIDDVLGLVVLAIVSKIAQTGSLEPAVALEVRGLRDRLRASSRSWSGLPLGQLARRGRRASRACGGCSGRCAWRSRSSSRGRPRRPTRRRSSAPSRRAWCSRARTGAHDIDHALKPVVDIFAPLFFVYVGAQVDVRLLNPAVAENRPALLLGARADRDRRSSASSRPATARGASVRRSFIGAGMVPRGEVGLIFAALGLADKALPDRVFVAVLLAVFATTFVTPPLLKLLRPRAA